MGQSAAHEAGSPAASDTLPARNTVSDNHAGVVPKAKMPHAFQRFMKPTMSNTSPVSGNLGSTSYVHLPDEKVNAPVPVFIKHGVELKKGIIEGDHHSKNTNPGL